MKSALPVCGQDIALVFDDADFLLLIEAGETGSLREERLRCSGNSMIDRANQLRSLDVDLLICGAISCPLQRMIEAQGIDVIPFVRGKATEVFDAYCRNRLEDQRFLMPGRRTLSNGRLCRGQQKRRRARGDEKA
ncbi:Predicted Fe-Mo cluster-binding protein, NifX family [Syntrophus gentianae]|uniref:Predicted Fe-Mo cluster-binding protein, NifX family n=1 Tax=Syntrophus gentianae TaxID=43775 RepID=A0A1H7V584_9BACT|nr:NifB/NifX family molybdenum-iron cluster-binding protein [Syntrophus gentianae]SEM04356.1 Predicted Fe-Mo cluster-binding protein, NifX family [Syntrophus gentianae]